MQRPEYQGREQTEVKHQVLRRYLQAAIPILAGSWVDDLIYVDCLAGPWESKAVDLSDTSFFTAVETMRNARSALRERGKEPAFRCLFVEKDKKAYAQLSAFAEEAQDVNAVARNWDFEISIPDVVRHVKEVRKTFGFYFIDPKGWEQIAIPLISPILKASPNECLITLMTAFIRRFVKVKAKGFDKILGHTALAKLQSLTGHELEEELVREYSEAARRAGNFNYACALPIMKPKEDDFHFYMIYLTRNIRGVEVFKETEKSVVPFMHGTRAEAQSRLEEMESGQLSLLSAEQTYREQRYTDFRMRQLGKAKTLLVSELKKHGHLPYEDAWATVMQHAAVLDNDLRDWIARWRHDGHLELLNTTPTQRVPQKTNVIKWLHS